MTKTTYANRGARLLALAMEARKLTTWSLRKLLGCSSGLVSKWLDGSRLPGRKWAVQLQAHFGIPVSVWDEDDVVQGPVPDARGAA